MVMYGIAFTKPTIQLLSSHHCCLPIHASPESGMPMAVGNERLAPLEPVYRAQLAPQSLYITSRGDEGL